MSSLKEKIEKIKNLEAEKNSLLLEMDELKKIADAKAVALEGEVANLRDDVKLLKMVIGQEQVSPTQQVKIGEAPSVLREILSH